MLLRWLMYGVVATAVLSQSACSEDPKEKGSLHDVHSTEWKPQSDVMVHLFNWPFAKIEAEIPQLAADGYGTILISPPNLTIETEQWWGRYQPSDYRAIGGPLGNQQQLESMIKAAHDKKMHVIVDVALNHTANESSTFPPLKAELDRTRGALFQPEDYHSAYCITNYNDIPHVRSGRICGGGGDAGLPDLRQDSEHVLKVQREFLVFLNSLGVDGYRLDAVKHMEPSYFTKLLTPDIKGDRFAFGEVITSPESYERDLAPYADTHLMGFYDFQLRGTMQNAFGMGGRLSALLDQDLFSQRRALPGDRAVTFVINHDLPNNDIFRGMIFNEQDEKLGYGFILGRAEGRPLIYSTLEVNTATGIRDERWVYDHRDADIIKMVKFRNAVQGTPTQALYSDNCTVIFKRGDRGLVGINKCGESSNQSVEAGFQTGQVYSDLFSGRQLTVQGSRLSISVPARSLVMYLKQ